MPTLALFLIASLVPASLFAAEPPSCAPFFSGLSRIESAPRSWGEAAFENAIATQTFGNLMAYPFRPLARSGSISVVGRAFSGRENGQIVLRNLQAFDATAESAGFRVPSSTRVILGERTVMPNMIGPFSVSHARIFNVADFRLPENTIAMNPMGFHRGLARSATILSHERAHGVLGATYVRQAFVNRDTTVQEALADFMAAHHHGNPALGVGAFADGVPLRDIKNARAYGRRGGERTILSPGNFSEFDSHRNSLLFSNLLWRIRETVGPQRMNQLLKPIIDDLNSHFPSIGKPLHLSGREEEEWVYRYFLASLSQTMADRGERHALNLVLDAAKQAQLTTPVENMRLRMRPMGNFQYDGAPPPVGQTLVASAVPAGVVVAEGALLYYVGRSLLPGGESENREQSRPPSPSAPRP